MTEPHDDLFVRDLEAAVLSALFLDPDTALAEVASVQLTPDVFTDRRHRLIYAVMLKLKAEGQPIDPHTVTGYLAARKRLDDAGGQDYLARILDAAPHARNVRGHALMLCRTRTGPVEGIRQGAQDAQVGAALDWLELPLTAFQGWCYPVLDSVLGPIPPGTINFLCAASGQGKTSFLLSLMCRWHATGRRIYYAGLETKPNLLRTQWACRVLGLDPGEILSGRYFDRFNPESIRTSVRAELLRQREDDSFRRVRFAPHAEMNVPAMIEALTEAHEFGADLVVIDHIDHIGGEATTNHYAESREVHRALKTLVDKYGLRTLIASQLNNTGLAADPLLNHRPVRPERLYMGGHKMQLADLMLGLYRPLRGDITKDEHAKFKADRVTIDTLLEEHVSVVHVMKHRLDGKRTGARVRLGYARGEIFNSPLEAKQGAAA